MWEGVQPEGNLTVNLPWAEGRSSVKEESNLVQSTRRPCRVHLQALKAYECAGAGAVAR